MKVTAMGGEKPDGLAVELERLTAERLAKQQWPDVQITITNLNGFISNSGGCPHAVPAAYQESMHRLFKAQREAAPRGVLFIGGDARLWSIGNAADWNKFRDSFIHIARNEYNLIAVDGSK